MKRWYRKTVVKVIAVIVGIVSGAVFSASLLASISLAGTVNPTDIRRILTQAYEDSEDFLYWKARPSGMAEVNHFPFSVANIAHGSAETSSATTEIRRDAI